MYITVRRILPVIFFLLWGFTVSIGFLCATGCAVRPKTSELFFYRTETVSAEVSMECNGASSRFMFRGNGDTCSVEFTAPEELRGFILEIDGEGGRVTVDGLSTAAPDALCIIPNVMRRIFALSPDDVTAIETAPPPNNSGETVTKVTTGEITVTLDKSGIPLCAEGVLFDVSFKAEISDLAVIPTENADQDH